MKHLHRVFFSFVLFVSVAASARGAVTQVIAWGRNGSGQTNVPAGLTDAVDVAAGGYTSFALRANGTVVAWGNNAYGQATPPLGLTNVIAIGAGFLHALALRADGTLVGWGSDYYGESENPTGLSNVVAIAAGQYTSAALRADGTVMCWGENIYGVTNVPAGLSNVVAIAMGITHALALRSDGTLVVWGAGAPVIPGGITNAVEIKATYFSMVLLSDGTLQGWGSDYHGVVSLANGRSNVVAFSAGPEHVLGLECDGTVVAWGNNAYGETTVPAGLSNVVAVAAAGADALNHSVALIGGGPASPAPSLAIHINNGTAAITLNGQPRAHYVIEYTDQLGPDANWQFAQNVFLQGPVQAVPGLNTSANATSRFYRARFVP